MRDPNRSPAFSVSTCSEGDSLPCHASLMPCFRCDSLVPFLIMEGELTLRIILEAPPPGVDFGLQKGRGTDYETIQTQRSSNKDLRFEFVVRVKADGNKSNFLGPFVQGPPAGRFVYLDIGTCAGQSDTFWSRRLKVPLVGITVDMIERAMDTGSVLEARVPGTGKDGGPTCATVKPFAGWKLSKAIQY